MRAMLKTNYIFLPLSIFAILLYIFHTQIANQYASFLDKESHYLNYAYLLLSVMSFIYLNLCKPIDFSHVERSMLKLLTGVTTISYLFFLIHGTPAIVYYLMVISPIFVLLFLHSVINKIELTTINVILLCIISWIIFQYFTLYLTTSVELNAVQLVTNSSYYLLLFLPIVLCINNKWIRYSYVIIISIAVLLSTKRGGIIALLLSLFFYTIINIRIQKKSMFKGIFWLSLFSLVAVLIFLYINKLGDELLFTRFANTQDSHGSGRLEVYMATIAMIEDSNILNILIGHGWDAVLRDSPLMLAAHNDFLEVLYDFGLINFIFYLSFYVHLFSHIKQMYRSRSPFLGSFVAACTIFLILSMVSILIINPSSMIIIVITFTYLIQLDKNYSK